MVRNHQLLKHSRKARAGDRIASGQRRIVTEMITRVSPGLGDDTSVE
jgi:hypothetical protein